MPRLARPDGVELAWEQRGSGPAVVVVWPWNPSPHSLEPLVADLARDHRVIVYAARGTGDSTRVGPYDAATDAAALAAVVETAADGQAVIVAPLDAIVQAADAAVRLPTAIMAVVAVSSMLRSRADSGSEALADSPEVLRAMLQMIEISYRAGLHALVSAGNPDLDEAEVQRRVEETLDFAEPEAATERLRRWVRGEGLLEQARALADRSGGSPSRPTRGPPRPARASSRAVAAGACRPARRWPFNHPELTTEIVRQITAGHR